MTMASHQFMNRALRCQNGENHGNHSHRCGRRLLRAEMNPYKPMKNRSPLRGLLRLVNCAVAALSVCEASAQTTWFVNNTTNIGGHGVTVLGDPHVVSTPYGGAVQFDGMDDGLVVSNNPLAGFSNLTVELIFKHDPLSVPTAHEPRIVHVQSDTPPDHRLTLETRVSTNTTPHTFHLDTYLKFGDGDHHRTLFNKDLPHPVSEWTHLAATYDGTNFCNYLNGQLELCGALEGKLFANTGATWIGQRANNVAYFEGAVLAVRFTPHVLATNEFMRLPVSDK